MAEHVASETLILVKGSSPTLAVDMTTLGAVRDGGTITSPNIAFVDGGSGVTIGTAEVIAADFYENGSVRRKVASGKGIKARFDATGGAVTPGRYNVIASATVGGGVETVLGELLVVDQSGEVP